MSQLRLLPRGLYPRTAAPTRPRTPAKPIAPAEAYGLAALLLVAPAVDEVKAVEVPVIVVVAAAAAVPDEAVVDAALW